MEKIVEKVLLQTSFELNYVMFVRKEVNKKLKHPKSRYTKKSSVICVDNSQDPLRLMHQHYFGLTPKGKQITWTLSSNMSYARKYLGSSGVCGEPHLGKVHSHR